MLEANYVPEMLIINSDYFRPTRYFAIYWELTFEFDVADSFDRARSIYL